MTDAAPPDRRALLQQALQALDEMQAKLDAAETARREPIAIVGMSCRFPGGATSLDAYWDLLCSGGDAVTSYPADRAELVDASGVDVDRLGDSSAWYGGFLTGIDQFDPQFFGIAPREAATMDPQQRLLLEVTWEALEHAGIAPTSLGGSATGVYVGITGNEYVQLGKLGGAAALDVYSATGGALNAAAGRVAYTLGLQGPAMAIDTACSSSLVAVHQACQSLRTGETTMALAGGVNMLLLPEAFVCFQAWGMMAPDGRCKTFDAAADGFVRGEGCGVVVLKLLRHAVADGDRVLAVLRGSAVNQDGASSGLTVPNGPAQQAVLRSALAVAGVAPADVQYFEAHGTGTPLGDPIEVEALGAVLGRGRSVDQPLVIGSVKTNIGHLESAAGIAGLIKVVLSIEHGEIPPNLHFRERNPGIPWPSFPVVVPTTVTPWPGVDGRRVAGVSGFGFSGTNAHVVVESPPLEVGAKSVQDDGEPRLLVLSGRTGAAAREVAVRWAGALAVPGVDLDEVVATAARGRAHLAHRAAIVDGSVAGMRTKLEAYAAGEDGAGVTSGRAGRPAVAFLFSGQGSQWVGMGRGLYEAEPVFRAALDRCAALWERLVEGPGLSEVLWGADGSLVGSTEFTQPALFALEWSLAELWGSWGVLPGAVLGHSVGEFVAAAVAGVFSVEDGFRLVAARGRLMGGLPAGGAMVAVMAPVAEVDAVLAGLPLELAGSVAVAAVNGAAHTVVSGAAAAVEHVVGLFAERDVRVSSLVVSHAFHSPLMVPVVERFGEVVAGVEFAVPRRRFVSNVSGAVAGGEVASAGYWVDHVTAPVRFGDGVVALRGLGVDVFVEVGPHPVLVGMAAADGVEPDEVWVGSLRRGRGDRQQVLEALAGVHVAGVDVAWERVAGAGAGERKAVLPSTPFQRHHHWLPPVTTRAAHRPPVGAHPLLGARVHAPALHATIHESEIRPDAPAWIADHRLSGTVVFPGSAYLEMFVAASDRAVEVVDDVRIQEALVLADDAVVTLQTVVQERAGGREAQVVSVQPPPEGGDGAPGWTVHARATLRRDETHPSAPALDLAGLAAAFPDEVDADAYYALLRSIGLTYGPTFRGLTTLRRRDGAAVGLASLPPDAVDAGRYHLHPALLDACFHVLGVAVAAIGEHDSDDMLVPVAVDGLRVAGDAGSSAWCVVTVVDDGAGRSTMSARVELFDVTGTPVATIDRLEVRRTPRSVWQRAAAARHPLYEVAWRAQPRAEASGAPGRCLVVGDGSGAGEQLAVRLDAAGFTTTLVAPGPATAKVGPGRWTMRGDDADGLRRLLGEVLDAGATEVVFLWPAAGGAVVAGEIDPLDADPAPGLSSALLLAQALAERAGDGHLWFVTRGAQSVDGEPPSPAQAPLWGFGRVLVNEQPQLACRLVDLDPSEPADAFDELVAELLGDGAPEQVALRGRRRLVARLTRSRLDEHTARESPYRLALSGRGSLGHLDLLPAARRPPAPGEVEVEVRATGINFRDVLNVLGMYPGDPGAPGLECAGVVVAVGPPVDDDDDAGGLALGDHVMGIAPNAFDSHVVTSRRLLVRMPAGVTFAEAATTPIAFLTAAYGLRQLAALRPGERVLVHAAAGGVGQAAVQLAQRIGAEVYATVGSPAKRRHLEALGVRHIYGSRTLDFAAEILADTDGKGVDVVLNSLADDFVGRSFDVLAQGGRFLEIGKRGTWTPEEVAAARPDASYHQYDLADFLAADIADVHASLQVLADDLADGHIRPLPLRAFPADAVEEAFRFMAQARHIGKVVVTHRPTAPVIRPDGTYLVTGGLGGIGLALAGWLVEHGAAAVVLTGRRPPNPATTAALGALTADGARVRVVAADIASAAGVTRLLAEVQATGTPLRGIFHAAGVVDDGAIGGQTWERMRAVIAPKVDGAALLGESTRDLDLDHFVLFSSASALLGAPGQSGYAAANTMLDAIALRWRSAGRPGLSIDWGAWSDVGMAARLDQREQERLAARGAATLAPSTALEALGALLATTVGQVAVLPMDWSALLAASSSRSPFLAELMDGAAEGRSGDVVAVQDVRVALAAADPDDRREVLDAFVHGQIVRVLGLDPDEAIDPLRGLTEIGMDSLMAVELSSRLRAGLGLPLPSTLAFEQPTFRALTEHLAGELSGEAGPARPASRTATTARREAEFDEVVRLSDDEAADRLLRELEESGY